MIKSKNQFYQTIDREIKKATKVKPSLETAKIAMRCLDLTSLTGKETEGDIDDLCEKASAYNVAAVCVYPEYVALAAKALEGSEVAIATVINFPTGSHRNNGDQSTAATTREDIAQSIQDGATEIDIVVDFEKYKSMEVNCEEEIAEILCAAKNVCENGVNLKVIVESAAFNQLDELYNITWLAMGCGCDFVKTSTGKHEDGGADMESVATMALAVHYYNNANGTNYGLKISGGVNADNYAQYIDLVANILTRGFVENPSTFRFGASGIFEDLKLSLDGNPTIVPARKTQQLGY